MGRNALYGPGLIAITPDGKTAYAVGTSAVIPIRTATNQAGRPINAGTHPAYIAIAPCGTTAYVADDNAGTLTPIDTGTGTAGPALKVGELPGPIVITR
jgi:hyaluronoglucosaminidase